MEPYLYKITYMYGENTGKTTYNYAGNLLTKTLSNYLFRNSKISGFLEKLQLILVEYIQSIKQLRVYKNFYVDKDYTKIE